jgi:hypothetical protein
MAEVDIHELDKKVGVISEVLHRLETNHLKHLQDDVARLDLKMWGVLVGIAAQLAAVVTALLVFVK